MNKSLMRRDERKLLYYEKQGTQRDMSMRHSVFKK